MIRTPNDISINIPDNFFYFLVQFSRIKGEETGPLSPRSRSQNLDTSSLALAIPSLWTRSLQLARLISKIRNFGERFHFYYAKQRTTFGHEWEASSSCSFLNPITPYISNEVQNTRKRGTHFNDTPKRFLPSAYLQYKVPTRFYLYHSHNV